MENQKVKNNNAVGDFLGKLVIPYMIIASLVGMYSFFHHLGEANIIFNIIMSTVAGLGWPIFALIGLFS
jgi:hypothetical protein